MIYIGLGLVATIAVAVIFVLVNRGEKKRETNYRTIFIMGIVLLPVGLVFDFTIFTILGPVYILWGLVNRDKWGKQTPKHDQLNERISY